ncbi:MAG: hypothetical protein HN509_17940 [Halobacteriovoraceae bacterium]|nr:hypothetical protein [Halobacteriovoraceae bacterium]
MKNLKIICLTILLGATIQQANAGTLEDIKEKLRPYIVQYLGAETANKILGADANSINMPKIPTVSTDAKDVSSLGQEDDGNWDKIPKDKRGLYNAYFVKEVFQAVKNRRADDNIIGKWSQTLAQGGSREGVYRAFVLDNDYAGKENFNYPLSDSSINFAKWYMQKFVNKEVKKAKLKKFNFYSLKRITTEKSLEIVDAFGKDKDNLHNWYAILSSDLATKYPKLWKTKTRQVKTSKGHKYWAQNMPAQFLKSELIVKVHMVYNHLNQVSAE